ncbi:MAG: helix-turn-helix domain-containing protein [Mesorhizobium sp.]|uniref:DNA-binding protein n=1 Tax=Mesorhizobium sp. TaxID=1871066 RepID=UPI001220BBD2|nr:DNA-binding protein [Mesorhizobium sp.]TIP74853.1 MAG: helix-turn-helix domain-containing protein [Mesorhizobium sp.]TIQ14635.1 MAG: helix-turn-helix domain-containing protein [Mesorhizobium sp.]TIR52182.1 MAG: helix-turn-helix domain-containing protein [Mesorhizobium sp.]TJV96262.1 MAG: helix-turn-helix domain-containing protein [Mesorhizobium sp.]
MNIEKVGYSPEQAAAAAGLGRTLIFLAMRDGKLKARKLGRRTVITADDLKTFLDNLPVREVAA